MDREEVEKELQKVTKRLNKAKKQVEQLQGVRMYIVEKACENNIMEPIDTPQGKSFKFVDKKQNDNEGGR